jgi:ribosome maturation factor RimP
VALQDIVQQTVIGLGLDLVEIERSAGGLLRITIDLPWDANLPEQFVNVEDCEKVTRQLQYALEVEEVEYKRLEGVLAGIDRPLRHNLDLQRFAGQVIDITLKEPVGDAFSKAAEAAGLGVIAPNRKNFVEPLRQQNLVAGKSSGATSQW